MCIKQPENGITGELPWRGSEWLGFSGENLSAVIDFGAEESFSKVMVDVLEDTVSWIYLPKSVEVFSSDDGINFKSLDKIYAEEIKQLKRRLMLDVGNTTCRFLKIVAENKAIIPVGSPGENNPAWLFVGEITVE
jgi:hexosaminidase